MQWPTILSHLQHHHLKPALIQKSVEPHINLITPIPKPIQMAQHPR